MSGALEQFAGAKIEHIVAVDDELVCMRVTLADGTERTVAFYHPFHETIAVRIDGVAVPWEDL